MAFLTFGGRDWDVVAEDAGGELEDVAGRVVRVFSGAVRSSVRTTRATRRFTLYDMTEADFTTLQTAVGNGAPIAITGDAFAGNASVRIRDFEYVKDGLTHLVRPTIEVMAE